MMVRSYRRIIGVPALAMVLALVACGGNDQQLTEPQDQESQIARIEVSPDSVRLDTTGQTDDFEAVAKDEGGNTVPVGSFNWSVSDTSVATIDSDGTVTARDNGVIQVTAEARGVTGSAELAMAPVDPLPTDRLVGANYFGWYGRPNRCEKDPWTKCTVSKPVLGAYNSLNKKVWNQHVRWALEHGVNFFAMCGCGLVRDQTYFLNTALGDDIKFAITTGPAIVGGGKVDLDKPEHRQELIKELSWFSEDYFWRNNYLRIDGRPVVFIFAAQNFIGDVQDAFKEVRNAIGVDPYVVALLPFPHRKQPPEIGTEILDVADALSTYSPYTRHPNVEGVFHSHYETGNHISHISARHFPWDFVPKVTPGWNDRAILPEQKNPVLEPSPSRFRRMSKQVQPHLRDVPFVMITSFNEWYEDNQIEPSEEFGEAYLDITSDQLATGAAPPYSPPGTVVTLEWGKAPREQEYNPDAGSNRYLSFNVQALQLLGPDGDTVASYDIGVIEEEPLFAAGAYSAPPNADPTYRWLGGRFKKTVFLAEGVEEVSGVELYGWNLEDMDVTLRIGDRSKTVHFKNAKQWFRIRF